DLARLRVRLPAAAGEDTKSHGESGGSHGGGAPLREAHHSKLGAIDGWKTPTGDLGQLDSMGQKVPHRNPAQGNGFLACDRRALSRSRHYRLRVGLTRSALGGG